MHHACCPVSKGQLNAFGSLAENKEAFKLLIVSFEYVTGIDEEKLLRKRK